MARLANGFSINSCFAPFLLSGGLYRLAHRIGQWMILLPRGPLNVMQTGEYSQTAVCPIHLSFETGDSNKLPLSSLSSLLFSRRSEICQLHQ
jgi:hypothetical protein